MAIGDTTNQNLFGTNYNAEEEQRKKAELAAQNARMGAGSPEIPNNALESKSFLGDVFRQFGGQVSEQFSDATEGVQSLLNQKKEYIQGEPGSAQNNFFKRMATGKPLSPQEIQDAQALAASMGTTFDPATGYSREAFNDSQAAPDVPDRSIAVAMGTGDQPFIVRSDYYGDEDSISSDYMDMDEMITKSTDAGSAKYFNTPMTGMRSIDPITGEPISQSLADIRNEIGLPDFQASVPLPKAPQKYDPVTYNQEETMARLGGRTLNEYLNAPPVRTPGISGLKTDPQGRMIPNVPSSMATAVALEPTDPLYTAPSAPLSAVDSVVSSATAQPPVDALSSFERESLARQQRIGGTGSFEGDSAAREARIRANERQPGETQAERDTRIAQSRTTGGQTGGMSFDDARRRAEGQLAARGVKNPSVSQVNALARGIQAGEPERLAELETKRALDAIKLRDAEAKTDFKPQELEIGGKKYIQYTPTYIQPVIEDTPNKTGLQATLENLQDDFISGRLSQEEYNIAVENTTNVYIGRKEPRTKNGGATGEVSSAIADTIAAGEGETTPSEFKTGEVREQGGIKYRFDGKKWNKVA